MLPVGAGTAIERISTSLSVMPVKLAEASVLYPHVFVAKAAGVGLVDAGNKVPRLFISVLFNALI